MIRSRTIAVDARLVFDEVRRGIAKTIVGTYRAVAAARPSWRFVLFHRNAATDEPFAGIANIETRRIDIPGDRFALWERVRLPLANMVVRADVFHAPAGPAPRFPIAPMVVTINDLIPLDLRPGDADVITWGASVRRAARTARVILTASDHARQRIVHHFGVPKSRVEVISWGPLSAPAAPPTPQQLAEVRAAYGIPVDHGYVLHFGMADPRKNTARTLDAWASLPTRVHDRFTLLIVGVQGSALERFRDQAAHLGVVGSAHVHGYVPEEDVRVLLAGATVMCYPTTYEGFGLPILDAFAAGVPVLSGDATSLPEVAGDAAVLVDATSTEAIRNGMARLLTDEAFQQELVTRGRERLAKFSWEQTGEQVARVFERVASHE